MNPPRGTYTTKAARKRRAIEAERAGRVTAPPRPSPPAPSLTIRRQRWAARLHAVATAKLERPARNRHERRDLARTTRHQTTGRSSRSLPKARAI